MIDLRQGDCLELMKSLADDSVSAVVTDPPYGLSFMGKSWDHGVPGQPFWAELLRVCKPGAHMLAFGGSRTYHRLACAIEDAGWEIRDSLMWVYGSGFPKSLDVSKAIDKATGAEHKIIGRSNRHVSGKTQQRTDGMCGSNTFAKSIGMGSYETEAATPESQRWQGWGTALKPAHEPIVVARKPLIGTVAANVLEWGTGALNIDACRVESRRWPANLIHDGSTEVLECFPKTGPSKRGVMAERVQNFSGIMGHGKGFSAPASVRGHDDPGGSAARFFQCCPFEEEDAEFTSLFYTAKASRGERDLGLGHETPVRNSGAYVMRNATDTGRNPEAHGNAQMGGETFGRNCHPTVKPISLMTYLVRMVSRPGDLVIDPFMGSGTTGLACRRLGRRFIGMELDPTYFEIARRRIGWERQEGQTLFGDPE